LLKCVEENEAQSIRLRCTQKLMEDITIGKILLIKSLEMDIIGPYYSHMFLQRSGLVLNVRWKQKLKSLTLNLIMVDGPFKQWGLDFIGKIDPHSSGKNRSILTPILYFTKWIEAIPTINATYRL